MTPEPGLGASLGAWDDQRWVQILDRIEHRQPGVGLRFWGPPLWLEVTMTGPDSDAWWTAASGDLAEPAWNWLSAAACAETTALEAAGGDDAALLEAASRYTIENLILNATHEIGEWLRFDGLRVFPAHADLRSPGSGPTGDGLQGNGPIVITLTFGPRLAEAGTPTPVADVLAGTTPSVTRPGGIEERVERRAEKVAAGWRFTYLPGRSIAYHVDGPRLVGPTPETSDRSPSGSTWSDATLAAVDATDERFVAAVVRDVHATLILAETATICEAFHVDGQRPWALFVPQRGPSSTGVIPPGCLTVEISYTPTPGLGPA